DGSCLPGRTRIAVSRAGGVSGVSRVPAVVDAVHVVRVAAGPRRTASWADSGRADPAELRGRVRSARAGAFGAEQSDRRGREFDPDGAGGGAGGVRARTPAYVVDQAGARLGAGEPVVPVHPR